MPDVLMGPKPGLLDATQPGRLLLDSGSSLLFATLDPRSAHTSVVDSMSKNGKYKLSGRIMIETLANGNIFWRFVPLSNLAIGLSDEGQWPRLVNHCGYTVTMSLDQWDIHKLDPGYECFIPSLGVPTIVMSSVHPHYSTSTEEKHRTQVPAVNSLMSSGQQTFATSNPSQPSEMECDGDTEDENWQECDPIEVDEPTSIPPTTISGSQSAASPPIDPNHRAEAPSDHPAPHDQSYSASAPYTSSSTRAEALQRELTARRAARAENMRKIKTQYDETEGARFRRLVHGILAPETTPLVSTQTQESTITGSASSGTATASVSSNEYVGNYQPAADRDSTRDTADVVGASSQGHHRSEPALAEQEHTVVESVPPPQAHHIEAVRKRAAELDARARKQAEIEESKRLIEEEARKQRETRSKCDAEQKRLLSRADTYRRAPYSWSAESAWEFFTAVAKEFDAKQFNQQSLLTVHSVPWPVFTDPRKLELQSLTTEDVEQFLIWSYRSLRNATTFKTLLVRARQRYHPDKWGSRKLLAAVPDAQLRRDIEAAVGVVAKAVGGIMDQVKKEEERQKDEEERRRKEEEERQERRQKQKEKKRGWAS